ncbi:DUF7249 family protein [Boseongicola aestuarii]|uniref:Uncharacterized protein n=1 Tax=Boseongicola aestuarii TaxID=1470561 RepID=A0A238J142_9RHOB|nr:hypothetical protein [Boseongicola aestuarii]SMX24033.1 hypothetical protein BOA8489_02148 [Boseongicola aestuarii]
MAYNGWKNKETWLVNLWLGDVLTMYEEEGVPVNEDNIEELVENILETELSTLESGFVRDILNCSLGEIDYRELAQHYEQEAA